MCGRYIQVKNVQVIEERFNVKVPDGLELTPNFNVAPGDFAPVITSDKPNEVQLFQFGLTPFWAKKPMYLFNARAEGDHNKENAIHYKGGKDIINKPAFRKPIRSQRCLVIADAFYEGTSTDKLNKPYVVYLKGKQGPFAFAGIWDTWVNKESGEEINSFAIITTMANSLMQKIPHHRSPIILPRKREQTWLNSNAPLTDITRMLEPFPGELMNAYPVASRVKDSRIKGKELITPIGQPLFSDETFKENITLELHGMGHYKNK
ncbi:MAG: SOS response-associated peptidase [Salinivirgaceae bacterium]